MAKVRKYPKIGDICTINSPVYPNVGRYLGDGCTCSLSPYQWTAVPEHLRAEAYVRMPDHACRHGNSWDAGMVRPIIARPNKWRGT